MSEQRLNERGNRMMSSLKVMWGVLRYEFFMQIRRPSLWLAFLGFALLSWRTLSPDFFGPYVLLLHLSNWQLAAMITLTGNWLAPLGVGILLADRLARDRRTRVDELFETLPATLKMRLLGKYLGATLATLAAAFLFFVLIISFSIGRTGGDFQLLFRCMCCYIIIVLPGMFFLAAFSIALPAVIWVPLYQFLFFGYWFWGNILSPIYGLPTLSGTILTPIGSAIGASFFKISTFGGNHPEPVSTGIMSIVVLVGIAVLVLVALYQFLRFERTRQ